MSEESISVLLVEDDEDDVVITRHLLSQSGTQSFEVRSAGRLHEAFMLVDQAPPQVILLDLSLPDSQGWQTLVSTLSHAPDIPIVLLTGLADEMMGVKAVQVGAQDYLFKGHIDRDRLARAIRYAIERKRSELALKRYRDHLEEMVSDRTLLQRVIGNMIKNALEASKPGETVTLASLPGKDTIRFTVHNAAAMTRDAQLQIFQRSFSTKGAGRGLGTYSMKLLTTRYLEGDVTFTSNEADGTTFEAVYPLGLTA